MKRQIALLLISIMVLMLSAFSFADDYSLEIKAPKEEVQASKFEKPFFITVWVMAESEDILEELDVKILDEDDDVIWSENFEINYVFGEKVFKYKFKAPELSPMEEFEITVNAEFAGDVDDVEGSKIVKVVADNEKDDDDDENDDDEEEMDVDMYPAAPSIANKLLKDNNIPNRVNGVNLIAAVAAEFADADKTEEDFADDVEVFLIDKLNDVLDEDIDELSELNGYFDKIDKDLVASESNKIKVEIGEPDKKDKEDKDVKGKGVDKDDDDDDEEDEE